MSAVWPDGNTSAPRISRVYGFRSSIYSGGIHKGVDTVGYIYNCSPENGVIIFASLNGSYGNEIHIQGDSGKVHRIGHNRSFLVSRGQRVAKGQRVGVQGATGLATGVHCHWEVRTNGANGSHQDPGPWVVAMNAAVANVGGGQRKVLPDRGTVTRRAEPTTQSAVLQPPLQPNEIGNFNGWIYGESVNGNNVWYRGVSGNWFWSGGFVGGANGAGLEDLNPPKLAGNQRQVKSDQGTLTRRAGPTTQSAILDGPLEPGVIGNFTHWTHGENVSGNDVWFQGTSGDWFWSGGFTDTGTHDLVEVKQVAPLADTQRRVLPTASANRRAEPNSSSELLEPALPAGEVGNFDAWTRGESVSGNDVWFRGTPSGNWFWSGGFTDTGTHGLTEIKKEEPTTPENPSELSPTQRKVLDSASANARSGPGTTYPLEGSALPAGEIGNFNGYAEGESVNGNKIWFRGTSGRWFWSGGFTDTGTHDLPLVNFVPPAGPTTRTPFYPGASIAYETDNGGVLDEDDNTRIADRPAGGDKIRRVWIHHTGGTVDQVSYFLRRNERLSCPTWYVRTSGEVIEFIRPKLRPWSTGEVADADALTFEVLNSTGSPNWGITEEAMEAVAKVLAWLSKQETLDGLPVDFSISREFVKGHREAPGAATACPGPSMDLDWVVRRAQEIVASEEPTEEPEPSLDIKAAWEKFKAEVDKAKAELDKLLGGD